VAGVSQDRQTPGHLPALDGLRALAVFAVVEHNISLVSGGQGALVHQLESMLHRGWMGVQLFFVLSGFLITRILLETRRSPHYFRSFYSRRALRIFPLYYAALIFLFVLLPSLGQTPALLAEDTPISRQIWLWTYLSNWTGPRGLGGGSPPVFHFWSLAVEEQFYLLWPLVVLFCTPKRLMPVCGGVVIASLLCRAAYLLSATDPTAIYTSTLSRMDALALGALVAAWMLSPARPQPNRSNVTRLLAIAIAITASGWVVTRGFPRFTVAEESVGFTFVAAACAALLAACVLAASTADAQGRWYRALAAPMLQPIAKYSYAIYVLHAPLHVLVGLPLMQRWFGTTTPDVGPALLYMAIVTIVSYGAGWLSYRLLEQPFLRLRRPTVPASATRSATAS
jgi:peptidoglycan/LPS O-acetylase OafA/YrhL